MRRGKMQWENARDKMPHMQRAVVAVKHKSFTKLYRNSGQYRRVQGPRTRMSQTALNSPHL